MQIISLSLTLLSQKGRFSFFSLEGWKNFRWGASHMQYAILDASGGAKNGKPKCARGGGGGGEATFWWGEATFWWGEATFWWG